VTIKEVSISDNIQMTQQTLQTNGTWTVIVLLRHNSKLWHCRTCFVWHVHQEMNDTVTSNCNRNKNS